MEEFCRDSKTSSNKPFMVIEGRLYITNNYSNEYACTEMNLGITVFKIVIWRGKSAVLRSEISFYGDASAET